jgi:enoyl-CoA hydratase
MQQAMIFNIDDLPRDPLWLVHQSCPVIAYGEACDDGLGPESADVVVADRAAAEAIAERVAKWPIAAMTLVQVLRSTERLPSPLGLDLESLAYSTLQGGEEYAAWQEAFIADALPESDGAAIELERDGAWLTAILNRPASRNAVSVEMRDALLEALAVLEADASIEEMRVYGRGACFSVGGELREFGSSPNPATAHWVRSIHSPARMLDKLGARIRFYLHGACLGSGIELPAFASRVVAHSRTFFQLPELQLGLIPGAGGTVSIARRIGRQRLAWMVLTGKRVNARTALKWGLVDEIRDWQ